MTESDIQKADPTLRKKITWLLLLIFVAGFSASRLLAVYLEAAGDDIQLLTDRLHHAVYLLTVAVLPALYFSFYLWRVSRRVLSESRFPPTKMAVIKDTPIRTGVSARRRGYFMGAIAIMLGAARYTP